MKRYKSLFSEGYKIEKDKKFGVVQIFNDKGDLLYIVNPKTNSVWDEKKKKDITDPSRKKKILAYVK